MEEGADLPGRAAGPHQAIAHRQRKKSFSIGGWGQIMHLTGVAYKYATLCVVLSKKYICWFTGGLLKLTCAI